MSKKASEFRKRAARELRESRNGGTAEEKVGNMKRAAALKTLSENEEWLDGQKQRPKRADKKSGVDSQGLPKDESKFG